MQRWADPLAGAATADAKRTAELEANQRTEIYWRTAMAAWAEGSVDTKDRAVLGPP